MLEDLFLGLPVVVICLLLQSLLVVVAIRYYEKRSGSLDSHSPLPSLAVISGVMLLLILGNLAQVAIWSGLFLILGEFANFPDAFYHSAVNFSTLGYGDIVMSERYRLLGPLEAINGILMVGVSTALLMSAFQEVLERRGKMLGLVQQNTPTQQGVRK